MKVSIICAKWNEDITSLLSKDCINTLKKNNVVYTYHEVPGAVELPIAAKKIIQKFKPDAVICIGCVIKGETDHYHFVASQTSYGCQKVAIETNIPVIFGVLTTATKKLALDRANGNHSFSGIEWAETAMKMTKFNSFEL